MTIFTTSLFKLLQRLSNFINLSFLFLEDVELIRAELVVKRYNEWWLHHYFVLKKDILLITVFYLAWTVIVHHRVKFLAVCYKQLYIYIYIYIYTHTHTHTHSDPIACQSCWRKLRAVGVVFSLTRPGAIIVLFNRKSRLSANKGLGLVSLVYFLCTCNL